MRVLQLDAPAPVASSPLREVGRSRPGAGPGQLLVEGELSPRRLPIVPGHQIVGRVVAVGQDVAGWQIGDRMALIWLASACGVCGHRRSRRENLCRDARFTGWDVDGGFATHAAVAAHFAVRLPPTFTDVAAAPLLCGGVIGYRALRLAGVAPGLHLGLYGFGASASLAIRVAHHRGARIPR